MDSISSNKVYYYPNPLITRENNDQSHGNKKHTSTDLVNDFNSIVRSSIKKVNSLEKNSEDLTKKLITGEVENIHEVMVAAEKAKLALQFTTEVRNKILTAYQEIMRMPV